jgi:predicted enzyme related to lactoylglutathione lyase
MTPAKGHFVWYELGTTNTSTAAATAFYRTVVGWTVAASGGAIHHEPENIPAIGRFAVVADPQGAVFCLFKPLNGMTPPAPGATPGRVGWHELHTTDREGAFAFYADLFGWTKTEAMDMGAMGVYQLFAAGGAPIGGMMTKPPDVPVSFWNYYFQVDGIGAAMERLKAGGGRVTNGPMEVPGGNWIVQGLDPQGAMFSLVSAHA